MLREPAPSVFRTTAHRFGTGTSASSGWIPAANEGELRRVPYEVASVSIVSVSRRGVGRASGHEWAGGQRDEEYARCQRGFLVHRRAHRGGDWLNGLAKRRFGGSQTGQSDLADRRRDGRLSGLCDRLADAAGRGSGMS